MTSEQKSILKTVLIAVVVGCGGFLFLSWLLGPFFSGRIILPQSFGIFGFKIQIYGLLMAVAVGLAYWLAMKRKTKLGISSEDADTIIFLVLISGFLGARVYHVVSEFALYLQSPLQVFAIWKGGLSIYGAGIGGVLAVLGYVWYNKRVQETKYSVLQILDWLTPSVVLGQIIGRFGNFANYELYGNPTNLAWKMFVPVQFRVPPFELNQFFHPLFLYEAMGSLVILIFLLRLKLKTGYLFLLWVLMYNVLRFFLEQLRIGSVVYGNIRVNGIVSLLLVVLAIAIWYKIRKK